MTLDIGETGEAKGESGEATQSTGTQADRSEEVRGGWRDDWRVLLAVFTVAGVVESQAFGHFNAFTPLFLQELHVPGGQVATWTGILSALGFVIGIPLLPFWGIWADRYGRKLIIVRSAYVEGVVFTLAAFSPNVWVLAVARFLSGFVFGNTGVMLALLADRTPRKRLGLAVGIAGAGFPLGASIGPYVGGLIAQGPGIRTLLFLDGCLSAAVGIMLTLIIREQRRTHVSSKSSRLLLAAVRDITASPTVARLFLLYFIATYGLSQVNPFIPILLQRLYRGPMAQLPTVIGTTLTASGIAMAVTTPLWGKLGDLIGRRRVLPICLGAVGLGLAAGGLVASLLSLQAAIVWIGLFQGGIGTTVIALLALLAPEERRASILNFSLLPSQLSWFIGPITGAALASMWLQLPFLTGAVALGVAMLLALYSRRTTGIAER